MAKLFVAVLAVGAYEMLLSAGNRKPNFLFGAMASVVGFAGIVLFGVVE